MEISQTEMKWEGWLRKESADSELYVKGTEQLTTIDQDVHVRVHELMTSIIRMVEKKTQLGITIEEQHGKEPGKKA